MYSRVCAHAHVYKCEYTYFFFNKKYFKMFHIDLQLTSKINSVIIKKNN